VGGAQLTAILLDTHVWAWSLIDDPLLSQRTREALASADDVIVSHQAVFRFKRNHVRLLTFSEGQEAIDIAGHLRPLADPDLLRNLQSSPPMRPSTP
jgi:hypothetical protein